jgi:hypothetical protein
VLEDLGDCTLPNIGRRRQNLIRSISLKAADESPRRQLHFEDIEKPKNAQQLVRTFDFKSSLSLMLTSSPSAKISRKVASAAVASPGHSLIPPAFQKAALSDRAQWVDYHADFALPLRATSAGLASDVFSRCSAKVACTIRPSLLMLE